MCIVSAVFGDTCGIVSDSRFLALICRLIDFRKEV